MDYWKPFATRRMSRRAALKRGAALGLGAAAVGLAACGGDEEEGAPAGKTPVSQATPKAGGKATLAVSADVGSLDPTLSIGTTFVGGRMYSPLHTFDARTDEIVPMVAESVEQVDETTYVWKIRAGVKFQDVDPTFGREVTARDAVYSFERLKSQPTINDKLLLASFTDAFEAVDDHTFEMKMSKPYAPTLAQSGLAQYCIVPQEAVEKWGDLSLNAVGCGPWILVDYTRGERMRLRKNPTYFQAGRPFLDEEEWLIIPDEGTVWQSLRTGRLDLPLWLRPDKLKRQEVENDRSIAIVENPDVSPPLFYTRIDRPPLNDARVQEALDLAIDRDDYIDKLYFGEGNYDGPVCWTLEYWALPQDELRSTLKHDPEKAKRLLSAAGYGDGFELKAPARNDDDAANITTVIADHYRQVGVKVSLELKDVGLWLADLISGNFEMTISRTISVWEPDFLLRYYHSGGRTGVSNSTMINDAEIDAAIEGASEVFDREERRERVHEVQRLLLRKHVPMHPLCSWQAYMAYSAKLGGVEPRTGPLYWMGTEYWRNEA